MIALLACRDAVVADTSTRRDTADTGVDPTAWEAEAGFEFIAVPPGTFTMGSPPEEVGRMIPEGIPGAGVDREVQHVVTLTRTLHVARTEVTVVQFSALMGYNPSQHPDCGDDCPVGFVTWHEATAFANALATAAGIPACYTCEAGTCEGPAADCAGYRLPTEAEWEYAARAGETGAFAGGAGIVEGTDEDCTPGLALDDGTLVGDLAWYCGNSGMEPQPVGERPENAWGLLDVQGNIHEWVGDWYGELWYLESAASGEDPTGPSSGVERVRRGGAWGHGARRLRYAYRGWHDPAEATSEVGFRLVRR